MIISALLIGLILLHGVLVSFRFLGVGESSGLLFARTGFVLLAAHTVFGVILTIQTIHIEARGKGKLYLRANSVFWVKRLTGIAILCSLYFHFGMFGTTVDGKFELLPFTTIKLIDMLVLVISLLIHIGINIRSLLVSMGIFAPKRRRWDIALVLSVILVFIAVSLILYYLSWYR